MRDILHLMFARWLDLPIKAKAAIILFAISLIAGIPTSERGWIWLYARQGVQLQNCVDDATKPLLNAAAAGDDEALQQAVSPGNTRRLLSCGNGAVRHPEGTLSFLWDEHKRMSFRSKE